MSGWCLAPASGFQDSSNPMNGPIRSMCVKAALGSNACIKVPVREGLERPTGSSPSLATATAAAARSSARRLARLGQRLDPPAMRPQHARA